MSRFQWAIHELIRLAAITAVLTPFILFLWNR